MLSREEDCNCSVSPDAPWAIDQCGQWRPIEVVVPDGRDCHLADIEVASPNVRFSNRPAGVKRFQAFPLLKCRCRSRARASLRTRHQGPSIMGFEDEVEQSFGRPCRRLANGRFKRTYELTSSIVPQGTSFHRSVELDYSPIAFG